jgi:mannose-6-phosphate isomerase
MLRVQGTIQNYPWGDVHAIARFLGSDPDGKPQAELWFGTHPSAPSNLADGRSLERVAGPLPFLVKVLAAGTPLSLQVHPTAEQAAAGFAREDAAGIPLDAPQRTYRDPFHKPELVYALTTFEAVCGVAPVAATDSLLEALGPAAEAMRAALARGGVAAAIEMLLVTRPGIGDLIDAAALHRDQRCQWLVKLAQQYPDDPSAAIVLLLNYVSMRPGDAIYLGAGNLHAYLGGVGLEIMASSDNVIRCGLTSKYVDTAEVLRVLDAEPLLDPLVRAVTADDGGTEYPVPVGDFRVRRYDLDGSVSWTATGPELVICADGETVELGRGECGYVADGEEVELVGTGRVFRVGTSLPPWG